MGIFWTHQVLARIKLWHFHRYAIIGISSLTYHHVRSWARPCNMNEPLAEGKIRMPLVELDMHKQVSSPVPAPMKAPRGSSLFSHCKLCETVNKRGRLIRIELITNSYVMEMSLKLGMLYLQC